MRLQPGQDWKKNDAAGRPKRERVEAELAGSGRVLIRASGTEPLLRVMVEAREEAVAQRSAERLAEAVRAG